MGAERFGVNLAVQLSGVGGDSLGVIRDLAMSGALIETDTPVTLGDQLTLTLTLPNHPGPLEIPFASVRWIRSRQFGVEFMTMDITAFRQLGNYLSDLKRGLDQSQHRRAKAA